jgi:uncharacterized membrane protein
MWLLIAGLVVFLGVHSLRIFAEGWRGRLIGRIGTGPYKGVYSIVSLAGFVLLVYGYGQSRMEGLFWYHPPVFTRHIASLLMLVSLVLVAAAYVPKNLIKARLRHPMIIGVKVWAFAHLLANGRAGDVLLFGAFLIWAVLDYRAARQRDRLTAAPPPAGDELRTVLAVALGIGTWALLTSGLHLYLIGVSPLS